VAERHNRNDIAKLREIIEHERTSLEDDGRFSIASNEFHRTLVQLAGVQTLGLIVDMLNEMLERHLLSLYISSTQLPGRLTARRKSIKAQEILVGLLETGNPQDAEAYWGKHLLAVGTAIAKLNRGDHEIDISRL
jgi:GntR family transcriptional regulator, transcriptional repressor for pyruvate dehydrogenase complex